MVATLPARGLSANLDDPLAPRVSRDGDRTVVWLGGDLDIGTTFDVAWALATAISVGEADVVVDLSAVTFMSASAIGDVLRARGFLQRRSRTLVLRSPSRRVRRTLDLCRLGFLVEIDVRT